MTIKDCRAELDKYCKKMKIWRWAFYLSLAGIVLCALFTFGIAWLAPGSFLSPAVLGWCMLSLLFLAGCFLLRWGYWSSRIELQACFLDSLENGFERKDMTRSEMIAFIKENPYVHITHTGFADDEYIYADHAGFVWDENGYLFENWDSETNKWSGANGIRLRQGDGWETGWYVKE